MKRKRATKKFAITAVVLATAGCIARPALSAVSAADPVNPEYPEPSIILTADLPAVSASPLLLEGVVPLDTNLRAELYGVCGCDPELFCAVMAIASVESNFDATAVGDNGSSLGLCQINVRYQADRVEALAITDLTDPVQNVMVAVDYIQWLAACLETDDYSSHALYMAYNMGLTGYRNAAAGGITSTEYSRKVMECYTAYRVAMEM